MPIAAAAPAIIGAAGSIGSALLSRTGGTAKNAQSNLSDLLGMDVQGARAGLNAANPLLRASTGATTTAQNYLKSLLGGKQSAMEAAAPEVNTILSQYDTAKRQLGQMAPRGGGTNATLAELPFRESGDITKLLAGERSNAAEGLARLGLGEGGLASSLLPRDTGAGSSLLNYALGHSAQQGQTLGEAGTALGTLLGTLFGGGGGGSPSGSDWGGFPPQTGGLDTFNAKQALGF